MAEMTELDVENSREAAGHAQERQTHIEQWDSAAEMERAIRIGGANEASCFSSRSNRLAGATERTVLHSLVSQSDEIA
jgi:hypothetical protein